MLLSTPSPQPDPLTTNPAQLQGSGRAGWGGTALQRICRWITPGSVPRDYGALGTPGSPLLTCWAQSLWSPGPRKAILAAGGPGAGSTWRCSSGLDWVGSALPQPQSIQPATWGSPPYPTSIRPGLSRLTHLPALCMAA
jgi:hypothetical protein